MFQESTHKRRISKKNINEVQGIEKVAFKIDSSRGSSKRNVLRDTRNFLPLTDEKQSKQAKIFKSNFES